MAQPILSGNATRALEKLLEYSDSKNGVYLIRRDTKHLPSSVGPKALASYCYGQGWAFCWTNRYYEIDTQPGATRLQRQEKGAAQ